MALQRMWLLLSRQIYASEALNSKRLAKLFLTQCRSLSFTYIIWHICKQRQKKKLTIMIFIPNVVHKLFHFIERPCISVIVQFSETKTLFDFPVSRDTLSRRWPYAYQHDVWVFKVNAYIRSCIAYKIIFAMGKIWSFVEAIFFCEKIHFPLCHIASIKYTTFFSYHDSVLYSQCFL